jgi:hypothetical protein
LKSEYPLHEFSRSSGIWHKLEDPNNNGHNNPSAEANQEDLYLRVPGLLVLKRLVVGVHDNRNAKDQAQDDEVGKIPIFNHRLHVV